MVSTLVIALPVSVHTTSPVPAGITMPHTRTESAERRSLVASPWKLADSWETWGFRAGLVTIKQGHLTDYNINFSVSLPLARILGSYVLTGSLSLRSTPLRRSSFMFRHPSYFAVARVVDKYHPFMSACWKGDTKTVQFMLRSGEGRPTDQTSDGRTPMAVSDHT